MICVELFLMFFKIGLFTFGGGYAMLPLIQQEVAARGWLSQAELVNFIAVSESTPGPFAVNISTYVGAEVGGVPGAICATVGVVLPSFIIILIVARCFDRFRQSRIVEGCMEGLKPAVVGLIAAAAVSVAALALFPHGVSLGALVKPDFLVPAGIFLAALPLAIKKVHPILIIIGSAAVGIAAGYIF